jgi:FAD linked oxidases, C-terminal domain
LRCGGTITGEHSIGLEYRDMLVKENGPTYIDTMRQVKLALDPLCLLDPDKCFRTKYSIDRYRPNRNRVRCKENLGLRVDVGPGVSHHPRCSSPTLGCLSLNGVVEAPIYCKRQFFQRPKAVAKWV